jgi:hypothetical protein
VVDEGDRASVVADGLDYRRQDALRGRLWFESLPRLSD